MNYAAVEALGYSKEELLTMTVHDIGPEFPVDIWPAHWAELKEKKSFIIQTIHQRKDESTFPVEITVNFIQFGSREINCAIARNITDWKQAEDVLRESEDRLRQAQKLAHIGHWDWDMETNELHWSEETFLIFGQDQKNYQVSVEAFESTIHPDDFKRFIEEREQSLIDKRDLSIEHRIMRPDGTIRNVHELTQTVYDHHGDIIKVLGTVQDITER